LLSRGQSSPIGFKYSKRDRYDCLNFLLRGTFFGMDLDVVFTVETDRVVVVTQMSQHSKSLRGRFYEQVGTTAADAVTAVSD